MAELHEPAQTVLREGEAFTRRHEAELGTTAATMGGWAWGFMRAIAECPDCGPGVYRVPVDPDWATLACRQCGGVWRRRPQPVPSEKPTRARRSRRPA